MHLWKCHNEIFDLLQLICTNLTKKEGRVPWLKPLILATKEVEIKRILVQGQHRQKFHKTSLDKWLDAMAQACHPSYVGKHK
jgi:hypothetical protein